MWRASLGVVSEFNLIYTDNLTVYDAFYRRWFYFHSRLYYYTYNIENDYIHARDGNIWYSKYICVCVCVAHINTAVLNHKTTSTSPIDAFWINITVYNITILLL